MKRKTAIKKLMGYGMSRNEANRRLMYGKPVPVDTTEYYPSLILLTEDGFTNLQAFLEGGDSID